MYDDVERFLTGYLLLALGYVDFCIFGLVKKKREKKSMYMLIIKEPLFYSVRHGYGLELVTFKQVVLSMVHV